MIASPSSSKVLLGFTGGIRSSVTAMLLKTQGAEVFSVFLDYEGSPWEMRCARDSKQHALEQAATLEIPLVTVPVSSIFEALVADSYLHHVLSRKTPQSCLFCHQRILFPVLAKVAEERGIASIATGHRAILNRGQLEKTSAKDDQSSWLAFLNRELLARISLPLGSLSDSQIEKLAREISPSWPEASHAPRLQCQISKDRWLQWSKMRAPQGMIVPGPITHLDSIAVAEHRGILENPLGSTLEIQEKGPLVAWDYDPNSHVLKVEAPSNSRKGEILIEGLNWIDPAPPAATISVDVQVQSAGLFTASETTSEGTLFFHLENEARLTLRKPMTLLIRGTPLIFSSENRILGAGWIA
ncbi:MAG: hypothetical protein KGQ59_10995 [Bdellovibrionales bacterium]|nr:hypothetical protein [Bdellovibrionales bacterium]